MPTTPTENSKGRLEQLVAEVRQRREALEETYREQALKLFPRICARCGREFSGKRLRELTVHHRDHNHNNNPPDGSNWELLCLYCHDNEHRRYLDHLEGSGATVGDEKNEALTHSPFAKLGGLLKGEEDH